MVILVKLAAKELSWIIVEESCVYPNARLKIHLTIYLPPLEIREIIIIPRLPVLCQKLIILII